MEYVREYPAPRELHWRAAAEVVTCVREMQEKYAGIQVMIRNSQGAYSHSKEVDATSIIELALGISPLAATHVEIRVEREFIEQTLEEIADSVGEILSRKDTSMADIVRK